MDFYCEFELDWYPFDKQNCNIEIENFGNKDHLIDLVQKQVRLQGRKHVYQYIVEKPTFVDSGKNSIMIRIKLTRQLYFIILTNFIPIILINIVSSNINDR